MQETILENGRQYPSHPVCKLFNLNCQSCVGKTSQLFAKRRGKENPVYFRILFNLFASGGEN
jgi:hypothetical protein